MAQTGETAAGAYSVLVIDMFHHDAEEETIVRGFPTIEMAIEYARRRTRDSVEELRQPRQSSRTLRQQWLQFGEDCCVIGQPYCGVSEIDYFVTHPATKEERDWQTIQAMLAP
jgi:hypothetical protein